ncbi:MAG: ATP-dependent helicase [Propionibacteriaceae bacterium]|jgi:superfamily I DNA/RNA helicase/RecB family exonuclease|nr:ATP-dependent helicase [Propionibacteriaceae bacterium]
MDLTAPRYRLTRLPRDDEPFPATPAQRRVIEGSSEPLLVLGGPGTGKTATLVEAAVAQLRAGRGPALVIAGSASAAGRLREALARRDPDAAGEARIVSWAGLSHAVVRRFSPPGGMRSLTAAQADQRIRELLASRGAEAWPPGWAAAVQTGRFARQAREALDLLRREGVSPDQVAERASAAGRADWGCLAAFFEAYLDVLALEGGFDQAELTETATRAAALPEHAGELRELARLVFVDEYEEVDASQVRLLEAVTAPAGHLVAFGDPRQAVGGFRGAAARSVLDLPERFQTAAGLKIGIVELEESWRQSPALAASVKRLAARIALPRRWPLSSGGGKLQRPGGQAADGGPPEAVVCESPADEAAWLAERLWRARADGLGWEEMAVIVRTGRPIGALAAALTASGVPVAVEWEGLPLADEPAVQTLLEALQVAVATGWTAGQRASWLRRLAASPLGGSELEVVQTEPALAAAIGTAVWETPAAAEAGEEAAEAVGGPGPALGKTALSEAGGSLADDAADGQWDRLLASLKQARCLIEAGQPAVDALWALWEGSGWADRSEKASAGRAPEALAADRALDAVTALFELAHRLDRLGGPAGVQALAEEAAGQRLPARRLRLGSAGRPAVAVLTAHRAKGRQWPLVAVAAVQEGLWPAAPHSAALLDLADLLPAGKLDAPTPAEQRAAERRLFYVACSRAIQTLIVTAADQGESGGLVPSRFLEELGRPAEPVGPLGPTLATWTGLVGLLRRTAADAAAHPVLRDAACLRLADLASARGQTGRALVPQAAPEHWWAGLAEAWPEDSSRPDLPAEAVLAEDLPARRLEVLTPRQGENPGPRGQQGEVIRLSGSQVDGLLACPRQWFLARRVKAEGSRSPGAQFGTLIHVLAQALAAGQIDRDEAVRRLDAVWPEVAFPAVWQAASERGQAVAALDRLEAWRRSRASRTVLGLEVRFEADVAAGPHNVRLTGQIDRLDRDKEGRLWVVDFKTGKVPLSRSEAEANGQLGAYQLALQSGALKSLTGKAPDLGGAELVYVRLPAKAGASGPKVLWQASLDDEPQLEEAGQPAFERLAQDLPDPVQPYPTWVHQRLATAAQIISEARYPALAGRSCRWCQFQSSCPVLTADEEDRP